jgi:hypothetical protein
MPNKELHVESVQEIYYLRQFSVNVYGNVNYKGICKYLYGPWTE